MVGEGRTDAERVVAEAFTETLAGGCADALDEYFAPDLAYQRSSGERGDRADLEADVRAFHAAFPDLDGEIHQLVSTGDTVAFFYSLAGTHEGELGTVPPTGRTIDVRGAAFARVEDGSIVEYRTVLDNLGLRSDLGLVG